MKLSQCVRYAVACLFELSKYSLEYIDAEHIATAQKIPHAYAHKILQHLAKAGYVFSHKGCGYKLARPLSDITALEIIELLTSEEDPSATNPDMGIRLESRVNEALSHLTLGELNKVH